eukprot:scaffold170769_cov28-Tisochrysis_lutea.AAC.2
MDGPPAFGGPPDVVAVDPPVSSSVTEVTRWGNDSKRSWSCSRLAATSSTVAHVEIEAALSGLLKRGEGSPALDASWNRQIRPSSTEGRDRALFSIAEDAGARSAEGLVVAAVVAAAGAASVERAVRGIGAD